MFKYANFFLFLAIIYMLRNFTFKNELMSFMDMTWDSEALEFPKIIKLLERRYHPDKNNGEDTKFWKVQDLKKSPLGAQRKFDQVLESIYIYGNLFEDKFQRYITWFRHVTKFLVVTFLLQSAYLITARTKRALVFLNIIFMIFFTSIVHLFIKQFTYMLDKIEITTGVELLILNFELQKYFGQTSVVEMIDTCLMALVACSAVFVLLIHSTEKAAKLSYSKIYAHNIGVMKNIGIEPIKKKREILEEVKRNIEEAMPEDGFIVKYTKKIFKLISMGLFIYSLIRSYK